MSDAMSQHFSSPIGTWDEWLELRQQSDAGKSPADVVAFSLQQGFAAWGGLDLGVPPMRQGLRDLLDEFEAATADIEIVYRAPRVPSMQRSIHVAAVDGNVSIGIGDPENPAEQQLISLDQAGAVHLAGQVVDLLRQLYGEGF